MCHNKINTVIIIKFGITNSGLWKEFLHCKVNRGEGFFFFFFFFNFKTENLKVYANVKCIYKIYKKKEARKEI